MDALFAKGKEFVSSQLDDKETSDRREKTKHHDDDVDDYGDRPAVGRSGGRTAGGDDRSDNESDGRRPSGDGRGGGRYDDESDGRRPSGDGRGGGRTAGGGDRLDDESDGRRPSGDGRGGGRTVEGGDRFDDESDGRRPSGDGRGGGRYDDESDGRKIAGADHGAKKSEHQQPTKSELMASAKLVASVAQSKLGGGGGDGKAKEELDTGKLAGAAADLLAAASQYGKLGDEGIGKYIGQAEDYLHGYELKNSKPIKAAGGSGTGTGTGRNDDDDREHNSNEDDGKSGDYIKMAQGLFNKKSGDGDRSPRGDDRDHGVMKMAQGLFK